MRLKNLRKIREEKGISITQLADQVEVDLITFQSIEAGLDTSTVVAQKLADALDVQISKLAGYQEPHPLMVYPPPVQNDELSQLREINRKLDILINIFTPRYTRISYSHKTEDKDNGWI